MTGEWKVCYECGLPDGNGYSRDGDTENGICGECAGKSVTPSYVQGEISRLEARLERFRRIAARQEDMA